MANRRLAPAEVQPGSFAFTAENDTWAASQVAKYPDGRQASAVIPLLWKAQEQNGGWLPQKAIEHVADKLGMPYIRVLEVATFYTMFALEPVGTYWIQLCGTVPCDSCGARELKTVLERRFGHSGHVSPDGKFSWLEVECLGACCNAPMVQINSDYYEDLTPENFETLLDDLAAGRPVKVGSQVGRTSSEPQGAVNTLADATLYDGSRVGAWRKRFEETAVQTSAPGETKLAEGKASPSKPAEAKSAQAKSSEAKSSEAKSSEAKSSEARAASEPKIAKPDAGRAEERPAADAPAQRAANGETPVKPDDRAKASDPQKTGEGGAAASPGAEK